MREWVFCAATGVVFVIFAAPRGEVKISGLAQQGQTLTASNTLTDADGLGTISYQWFANNEFIDTGTTLMLTQQTVGKTITVLARYLDGWQTEETVKSQATSAVANINDQPTGELFINGVLAQGKTLAVTNNLADADGLGEISYQWFANGQLLASGASYTLTQAEVGKTVSVTAHYVDGWQTAETVSKTTTATVANVNDIPTGMVVINGVVKQGEMLTASNTLADADGLGAISYLWLANGQLVGMGGSYFLTQAEVGKTIQLFANYTDGWQTQEVVGSLPSVSVTNDNADMGRLTVTRKRTAWGKRFSLDAV
jgi:hypothetical protein